MYDEDHEHDQGHDVYQLLPSLNIFTPKTILICHNNVTNHGNDFLMQGILS